MSGHASSASDPARTLRYTADPPPRTSTDTPFVPQLGERYQVVGELGRGGMGLVYDAVDKQSGERVAIKVRRGNGESLLRFKNEFRLASRLVHPNLVALYDLVIEPASRRACIVMERVQGVDLRSHVRDRPGGLSLSRLRSCILQILDALEALGAAEIVHRDLKPANILVTATGQVKVLDFGLSSTEDTPDFAEALAHATPAYTSPEQAASQRLTAASDLYAVGAIVYELLVGEPPFKGSVVEVLRAHRREAPVKPSLRVPGVPLAIERWCLRLLEKRPDQRFPTATAAREAFEAALDLTTRDRCRHIDPPPPAPPARDQLLGRTAEQAILRRLLDEVRCGATRLGLIVGESGLGKSTLAEALLTEAEAGGCVTLRGACREHEAIAYNAFDGVVDGAAAALDRLLERGGPTTDRLARSVRGDVALLARLFPVLDELPLPRAGAPVARCDGAGDAERLAAWAAAKRLVGRLTRPAPGNEGGRPLVILLDDVHWADEDSMALLAHLLAPPAVHGVLVIATAATQESVSDGGPSSVDRPLDRFLRRVRAGTAASAASMAGDAERAIATAPSSVITRLDLGPLPLEEAGWVIEAARAALPPLPGIAAPPAPSAAIVEALHREAAGNPFLLAELARAHAAAGPAARLPTVREVIHQRLARLAPAEAMLAELIALAPGPVDNELLRAAIGNGGIDPGRAVAVGLRHLGNLKILREIRTRARTLSVTYDLYHQRVREAVRAQITPARSRQLRLRLADTIAAHRPDDAEALVTTLVLAGEASRAASHAEDAAEAAVARLAHARAVEHYRLALDHARPWDRHRLRLGLARALEGVCRFSEAAVHYRAALEAPVLVGLERTDVELRLANCLIHGGATEESVKLVDRALNLLGHPPRRRLRRTLGILWLLLQLLVTRWLPRPPRRVDSDETRVRLAAYGLAVPLYQLVSRHLDQVDLALRFRLLGARSASPDVRIEAAATSLLLLLPFAHLGRLAARAVAARFARLEAASEQAVGERAQTWLPLLRALYQMVAGHPDRALEHFATFDDLHPSHAGYVALQRENALFLAAEYDRFVAQTAAAPLMPPLTLARLAYVAHLRGDRGEARRLCAFAFAIAPAAVPQAHRAPFVYQLVELHLLRGETQPAAMLARQLLPLVRRGAMSPAAGAFESADAITRALLADAHRLFSQGERGAARALVDEAARALRRAPLAPPPLFAARLDHDRALVALAGGRPSAGLRLLERAELRSRHLTVPALRHRLLEDLLHVLPAHDPRRAPFAAEAAHLARRLHNGTRTRTRPAWLLPLSP